MKFPSHSDINTLMSKYQDGISSNLHEVDQLLDKAFIGNGKFNCIQSHNQHANSAWWMHFHGKFTCYTTPEVQDVKWREEYAPSFLLALHQ